MSSDRKNAIIERYNRTQKGKLWKYFTSIGKNRWYDILPELTSGYNHTTHSSTKFRPVDVTKHNERQVHKNLYPRQPNNSVQRFKIGQTVRISRKLNIFAKGYDANYTDEIFKISKIKKTNPITYEIKALDGEPILGSFYWQEIIPVDKSSGLFLVEKIINRKTDSNGKVKLLIKWKGYSPDANSWVPVEEVFPLS